MINERYPQKPTPEERRDAIERRRAWEWENYKCSFCGMPGERVGVRLVAGPGVYICAECVQLCNDCLAEDD